MQIDTSVAEADVGSLDPSRPVKFSVDAFPGRELVGRILQVRLNPTIQQNVVTYNVVVEASNPDGILLPGMTANVTITVDRRQDVLRVPNAALSFRPNEPAADSQRRAARGSQVYVLEGGEPKAVKVRTGITDGSHTEIVEGELQPGDLVVLRELGAKKEQSTTTFRFRMM